MKKVLLIISLLVTSYNVFAFTTQGVWRWRNDDGSETSATWRADQNTPIMIATTDSTLRLRIELYNNGSGGVLDGALFEDSSDEVGGHWDTIKLAANTNAFMLAATSPFLTDLEPTTHQLSGQTIPPYGFVAGKEIVATEKLPNQTLASGKTSEFEYVIKPTANIKPNVTYYFRVDAANYLIGYVFPSLSTASVLPVKIAAFNASANKNGVLLSWTTATEENNNHFDIERSIDGRIYTKIATVQGSGTTSLSHNYEAYDNKPLNGINFYRIKQVDNDGKYSVSFVRSLKVTMQNYIISAYPNPSQGDIKFSLQNYNGTSVTATLTNVSGKVIHQEVIKINGSGNYKLNLNSKPASGIYILRLKGDALSGSIKIVVQ